MPEVHLLRGNNHTIVVKNATKWKITAAEKQGSLNYLTVEVERDGMSTVTFNKVLQVLDDKRERRHDKNHHHTGSTKKKNKNKGPMTLEEKILALFD